MELFRTIREKHQTNQEHDILKEAEERITISDFDNELFIAYDGVPLSPIDRAWTSEEILQKLSIFRHNFMNYRRDSQGLALLPTD